MTAELRVDADRLWARLDALSAIGATPAGGVHRLTLSDEDRRARDLFAAWATDLGLRLVIDGIGNMFAHRDGSDPDLLPVLIGSHLDSQPTGGNYDGPLGVLAALEVVQTLDDADVTTRAPLVVANWTNEEGARFAPAMMGSGVFSTRFELDDAMAARDADGVSVAEAIDAIGYRGTDPVGGWCLGAALELHIEQGPILEQTGHDIGIVTGVQGTRWFDLTFVGEETHAGPTPMTARSDPMAMLGSALVKLFEHVESQFSPEGRITFGVVEARPASRNTVPGEVTTTVDIRHPDDGELERMEQALGAIVREAAAERGGEARLDVVWRSARVDFSDRCIEAVRAAADTCGYSASEIMAGAGHDSVHVADVAPTSMIFVPCKDGVSHNEAESITRAQAAAGANVLLQATLVLANP